MDFTCGTWGGRPFADGLDGNSNIFANMASTSVEITEAEHPIAILAYEFVPDKAGLASTAGARPTGVIIASWSRGCARCALTPTSAPMGCMAVTETSWNYLNPDGENRLLPSKVTAAIPRGTVFRHEVAGAGAGVTRWSATLPRYSKMSATNW